MQRAQRAAERLEGADALVVGAIQRRVPAVLAGPRAQARHVGANESNILGGSKELEVPTADGTAHPYRSNDDFSMIFDADIINVGLTLLIHM